MIRRTAIYAFAALMVLFSAPQAECWARSVTEQSAIIWQTESQDRQSVRRETVSQQRLPQQTAACFPEPHRFTHTVLTDPCQGRAPPRTSTAR